MINPEFPKNETERLSAVKSYGLLDTLPESDFDAITQLISVICDVPISLITLLDLERNFLKSHHGVELSESPRSISFCGHAILSDKDIYIVEDARENDIFHDNPLVTEFKAIFYAGVPLKNPEGYPLGTLCVYDHKPRQLSDKQKLALKTIAKQVVNLFELRKKNNLLKQKTEDLNIQNEFLKKFSSQVSHDLKSPLANISSLTEFLKEDNIETLSEESIEYIDMIETSAASLREYIDGALSHYQANKKLEAQNENFELSSVFESISNILDIKEKRFELINDAELSCVNKAALTQILLNLVDNGFKYNKNPEPKVSIDFSEDETHYNFSVIDNGMGVKEENYKKIFELFDNTNATDSNGKSGTGIGLFTVKTLINKLGGDISVVSELNKGTTFNFNIKK